MRNQLRWLLAVITIIAFIGCQDELNVNNPIEKQISSNTSLNKSAPAVEDLTTDLFLSGSDILIEGTGTTSNGNGTINIDIPSGTIKNAYVYWEGRHNTEGEFPNGDNQIKVNGNLITGEIIGKANVEGIQRSFVFRADITNKGYLNNGSNSLTITDFVGPESDNDRADGAGVLVVIDDGTPSALEIKDGADWAYLNSNPIYPWLLVTKEQTFTFEPYPIERKAVLNMFVADIGVENGVARPHSLKISIIVGGSETLSKPFKNNSGPQWDTYVRELTIPAFATEVKVQIFSDPQEGSLAPASLVWLLAAMKIPTPALTGIGDRVWKDLNKNGIQDDGEPGFEGVKVELYDCGGSLVSTQFTNSDGIYLFTNLDPGSYYLKYYAPNGWLITTQDAPGSTSETDSDANPETGTTICTTLESGQLDRRWDVGLITSSTQLNSIGDFVWHDTNVNGIQDGNEPGISGVVVELLSGNSVIKSTVTDAAGKYLFTDLSNGDYCVRVASSNYEVGGVLYSSAQTKWYATKKNQGSDDLKDSDAGKNETACTTLNNNNDLSIDFGFYKTCVSVTKLADKTVAKPGETITYTFIVENCGDITLGGGVDLFDPMINPNPPYKIGNLTPVHPGTTKTLTKTYCVKKSDCGELVNTVKAVGHPVDGSANVEFSSSVTVNIDCSTPSKLGDKVWFDNDKDGIQDYNESGVKNVKVELYDCTDKLIASTYTNYYGKYYFTNLNAGDYKVKFYAPNGYNFTKKDQGSNDEKDSDVDPETGFTTCITLNQGVSDIKWDAGLVRAPLSKIGDKVWLDRDKDGKQDSGEPGVRNLKVQLFNCNGQLISTTYTNYNGYYSFSNLNAGEYKIKFNLPNGYSFTLKDVGTDDEKDSDVDQNGFTDCFTLGAGVTDLKWDAGVTYKSRCFSSGYWRTHSKYGPANPYDRNWLRAGTKGEDSPFFRSGESWYKVFWNSTSGNVYYILAHQFMAAKLNVFSGANTSKEVDDAIKECENLFAQYSPNQIKYAGSNLKNKFTYLASLLEKFNND